VAMSLALFSGFNSSLGPAFATTTMAVTPGRRAAATPGGAAGYAATTGRPHQGLTHLARRPPNLRWLGSQARRRCQPTLLSDEDAPPGVRMGSPRER
jgi:hypothetical protein